MPEVVVIEVSHDAVLAEVQAELDDAGMTLDRFRRLGASGQLEDPRLRDLWLMTRSALDVL